MRKAGQIYIRDNSKSNPKPITQTLNKNNNIMIPNQKDNNESSKNMY